MSKPAIKVQGRAIVDTYSDGYYMMLPDGVGNWYTSKKQIEKDVRAWAKRNSDDSKINVCTIEYRTPLEGGTNA
jgi:hypothetical protein